MSECPNCKKLEEALEDIQSLLEKAGRPNIFVAKENGKDVFEICRVDERCTKILEHYYNTSNVSLRGYGKVIKLARTIADIEKEIDILEGHILEAFSYRKNINGEII